MSATAFSFTSPTPLTAQPNGAGEKLIIRSDNAADTGNVSVTGLVAAVSTTDGPTALIGKRELLTADLFTSLTQVKLSAAQAGSVSVYGQGTAGVGDIRVDTLPANNDTLIIGVVGFTQTYTFKTTLTGAANEIKIAASVALQATNIYEAINAGANAGTDYGTGTAANAYVTATAPVGAVITLTDKIAVARQLASSITQGTGATISIRPLIGGVTGTLLATLTAGVVQVYNSFSLSTEDLLTNTLPALFTGSSDWLAIGGSMLALRFKGSGISSAIVANYKTSTDAVNAATGATAITNISNTHTVLAPQRVIPAEQNVEYIQLTIATNTNTADIPLDARAIFG